MSNGIVPCLNSGPQGIDDRPGLIGARQALCWSCFHLSPVLVGRHGTDPFQSDFPEVIEEYLEHGVAKCIAFNRRGTLLAGETLMLNFESLRCKFILGVECCLWPRKPTTDQWRFVLARKHFSTSSYVSKYAMYWVVVMFRRIPGKNPLQMVSTNNTFTSKVARFPFIHFINW